MPRIKIFAGNNNAGYDIGIWHIDETEEGLLFSYPQLQKFASGCSGYKSKSRRLEYLAVRALLLDMYGIAEDVFHHNDGSPYLADGRRISVSHTKGVATVIVSRDMNVAIDIEYCSDRVRRVVSHFLRPDENAETTEALQLCWCAKETLYKLHKEDKLSFSEMRVVGMPDVFAMSGFFKIENLRRGSTTEIDYMISKDYILTYAVEKIV